MNSPNILLIMTDEERYPPPYETEAVKAFRRDQLTARESIRDGALEFHRHYAGSTACVASRATLFTGQYPSLHGVSQTDGTSKKVDDPAIWRAEETAAVKREQHSQILMAGTRPFSLARSCPFGDVGRPRQNTSSPPRPLRLQ
jgi:hypothetical protein